MDSTYARNAEFHDRVAPGYDAHLAGSVHNLLARKAFFDLVEEHVPQGSTLLDFGCGTGIDALSYARHGYRVLAYDNSPGMVAQLRLRCQQEIASGQIVAWSESYPAFVFPNSEASAVVANFAVLNSIPDLPPLFDTFARNLAPPGWVIVSILNPLHWSKMKSPGWWLRGLLDRHRPPTYATQPYETYMHSADSLLRAAPQFHLIGRGNAGRFVRYDAAAANHSPRYWWGLAGSQGRRLERFFWTTPAYRFFGHFQFLVLRRDS